MSDFNEELKKAEAGSVVSQGYVGWCYLYGRDTDVNYQQAVRWLTAAAHEGRAARPFTHLGRMYAEGLGVPKDITEAVKHYKAVVKVELRAQLALARMYARGDGVPSDHDEARKLYSELAICDYLHPDPAVAAFAGAITPDELEEAKAYVRSMRESG